MEKLKLALKVLILILTFLFFKGAGSSPNILIKFILLEFF